jgi:NADPH2:quinone reductase
MRAIRVREQGDPGVLVLEELDDPRPGAGQVSIRLDTAGVNMIDVQQRSGAYPISLPYTPGTEGAGEVREIGPDVDGFAPGDRVAFAAVPEPGAYAETIVVPAGRVVPLPPGVTTETAAAVLLQGMTAHFLSDSVVPLEPNDVVVVHSAAGGVGLLLTQMASARGLVVVGTTSSAEKADRARLAGATDVVVRGERDLPAVVKEHSGGKGARAVFDSVGKDTFDHSLASLATRGYLVVFGQSSGPIPAVDIRALQRAGSAFLTRAGLGDYTATREELLRRADAVLSMVASGELQIHIHGRYSLDDAAEAHRHLQSGTTTGKLLLSIRDPAEG